MRGKSVHGRILIGMHVLLVLVLPLGTMSICGAQQTIPILIEDGPEETNPAQQISQEVRPPVSIADLFIQYGSMVLTAMLIVVGILTGMSGFSMAQSSRAARESTRVLVESMDVHGKIIEIRNSCAAIESGIQAELADMKARIEESFVEGALLDLSNPSGDAADVERRQLAIRILGELGHSRHLPFVITALEKEYETQANKVLLREAITRIARRDGEEASS